MNRINDTSTLDKATAYSILRMSRLLRMDLSRTLQNAGVGITPEQWFILFRLYEQDGLSQSDLADKLLNDHPNITRLSMRWKPALTFAAIMIPRIAGAMCWDLQPPVGNWWRRYFPLSLRADGSFSRE